MEILICIAAMIAVFATYGLVMTRRSAVAAVPSAG
jgi:hypothetical protein